MEVLFCLDEALQAEAEKLKRKLMLSGVLVTLAVLSLSSLPMETASALAAAAAGCNALVLKLSANADEKMAWSLIAKLALKHKLAGVL